MTRKDVLRIVDHTLLKPNATVKDIQSLIDDAIKYNTYSVCIPPSFVRTARDYVMRMSAYADINQRVKICTVIGFPNGYNTTEAKAYEAQDAILNGADEIDMVIDIGALKEKNYAYLERQIQVIAAICHDIKREHEQVVLKVIIETCLLDESEIREMCRICHVSGADYIKTSTGFSSGGATFKDIQIMRDEIVKIGSRLKIKAAGGIATFEDAAKMIKYGADRLGTSRLVQLMKG